MAEGKVDVSVEALAGVRLPAFWKQSPEYWFIHAESIFTTHRVNNLNTRVHFLVGALDEDGVRTVGDLLGPNASYDSLRTRLISAYGQPKSVRFRELVRPGGMGDRRPSQLLRDMRSVMPDGFGEDALKEFWLQKLPANIVAIISGFEGSLDSIATRADRVMEAANSHNIDAVAKDPIAELTNVVSSLAQQVQSMAKVVFAPQQSDRPSTQWTAQLATDLCYFHERFSNNARKCRPPCNFKSKSKEHTTPTPAEN
ncbi:uncharacterized protein LOC111035373 [Myzus persicae]|uniref:uncharacterized protein LOC111035373 n=1 Tax=Myzus persicae TaxID=13164 RepID=UPI000B9327C1|nr:uncharacterized protein LOC111035373 [Myzus persicae]